MKDRILEKFLIIWIEKTNVCILNKLKKFKKIIAMIIQINKFLLII